MDKVICNGLEHLERPTNLIDLECSWDCAKRCVTMLLSRKTIQNYLGNRTLEVFEIKE